MSFCYLLHISFLLLSIDCLKLISKIAPVPDPIVLDLLKKSFLLGHVIFCVSQQRLHIRHTSRIFVAGAESPPLVRHLGFEPTKSVEEAIETAQGIHGKDASMVFVKYPMLIYR
jgi:hypothetical protein